MAFKYHNAELISATDIHVALIEAGLEQQKMLQKLEGEGKAGTPEYNATRENMEKGFIELTKNATKIKDIASREKMKGKEIEAKERMNKDNNKTKLLNPTSGEKK